MEWNQYRDSYVGMEGNRILAIIDKTDDLPCEAYRVSILGECFVDVDSAKAEAEKIISVHMKAQEEHDKELTRKPPTYAETILPILKSVVAQLEETAAKKD